MGRKINFIVKSGPVGPNKVTTQQVVATHGSSETAITACLPVPHLTMHSHQPMYIDENYNC